MPRDSNGIYTLPVGNPVVSGTVIESVWANTTMTDIAQALTGSMPRDGSAALTGTLQIANGNLSFSGSAQRILGDFSNNTASQRLLFQTNVANGVTNVGIIPNGTSNSSGFFAYGSSDPDNASVLRLTIDSGASSRALLESVKSGTGVNLPLAFATGGAERFRLSATENRFQADFSNVTQSSRLMFQTNAVNGFTTVGIIPNGTNTVASIAAFGGSNPDNASYLNMGVNSSTGKSFIDAGKNGSGAYTAFEISTGGLPSVQVNTGGGVIFRAAHDGTEGGELHLLDKNNVDNFFIDIDNAGNARIFNNHGTGNISFYTAGVQRGYMSPGGELFWGGQIRTAILTVPNGNFATNTDSLQLPTGSGGRAFALATTGTQMVFYCGGNGVGTINTTTTNTSYNTTSDYRLKKNVRAMIAPLTRLLRLKPVAFNWRIDDSEGEGFIAHELQEEYPAAVTGKKDAVETREDMPTKLGDILPQGVDHSKLVPLIVAAVQEIAAKVAKMDAYLIALAADQNDNPPY